MQVEYKTSKGRILFRKVPNSENTFRTGISIQFPIPNGFEFVGFTSGITEEQGNMMVDEHSDDDIAGYGYYDYTSTSIHDTALESFNSLMQYLQVYEQLHESHGTDLTLEGAESRTGKWVVLFKPNKS